MNPVRVVAGLLGVVSVVHPSFVFGQEGYLFPDRENVAPVQHRPASAFAPPSAYPVGAAAVAISCGDPSGDGKITTADAQFILRASVGTVSCSLGACDVTGDSSITTADALRVLRHAVGQNVTLQCPGSTTTTTTTTTTLPQTTSNMTWKITDGCPDSDGLQVRLFDVDHDLVYPNSSQVYVIGAGNTVSIPITCKTGSKICYGASPGDSQVMYWGVGLDGDAGCESCCATCSNTTISVTPVCGLVEWTLTDSCYDGSGMQFRLFDVDHDLVSPPGNQVWVINSDGGKSAVAVACINGAKICYGAEPRPPYGIYWGIGIDGTEGCQSCCLTCPPSGTSKAQHNLVCD